MSACMPIRMLVSPSVYMHFLLDLPVCLKTKLPLFASLLACLPICLSVCLPILLHVYLSDC